MHVATESLIPLRDGYVVPATVMTWLIDAEFRGLRFQIASDHRLQVWPEDAITTADDKFIRTHRDVLRTCVEYCARMAEMPS